MKKVIIIILVVVALCVLAVLLAPYFIDLNAYKGTIVSKVSEQIHRDVELDSIDLTILGGIGAEINGLRIADNPAFSQEDFLSLDSLQVRVEFWPLLRKQVKVKKVILKKPFVRVQRNAKGQFNFDDLVTPPQTEPVASGQKQSPGTQEKAPQDAPSPLLAVFVVQELAIRDGKVVFDDKSLFLEKSPVVIDALDLDMKDISLSDPIVIDLKARLLGAQDPNFRLSGTVGPVSSIEKPENTPFDMKVRADALPLGNLPIALPLPMEVLSGNLMLDITASGSLAEKIRSETKVTLSNLVLREKAEASPGKETKPITCNLASTSTYNHAGQKIDIDFGFLDINNNSVSFKGSIEQLLAEPTWNMTVTSERLDPAALISLFPMYEGLVPKEVAFEGPARITLASTGSVAVMDFDAEIDMKAMHLRYSDLFDKPKDIPLALACTGNRQGGLISAKSIRFDLHHLSLSGSGQVDASQKVPSVAVQLKTQPVNLKGWDLITPLVKPYDADGTAGLQANAKGPLDDLSLDLTVISDSISFILPDSGGPQPGAQNARSTLKGTRVEVQARRQKDAINGTGTFEVQKGSLLNVAFDNLTGRVKLSPDQVSMENLALNVFKGSVKATGSYAMKSGKWSASPVFTGIAADTVMDSLTQFKGIFSGTLSGRLQASGSTTAPIMDTVAAKGSFAIDKGELKNFDLAGSLFDDFSRIEGMTELLGIPKENVQRHDTTSFDSLDTSIDMAGALVKVSSFNLKNIRTSMDTDSLAAMKGTVDLNSQALDLRGAVTLSQKQSQKMVQRTPALSALLNEAQRIVLPLRITGTIQKPLPNLDAKAVNEALARYYAKKGLEKGVKKLQEKLGIPGGENGSQEALDQLLKGILGK